MSIRRLTNAGLRFGWIPYEDGWAASGVDANWQWIDALAGRAALDVVTTLPTTGLTAGMLYLMAPAAGVQPNKLALYVVAIANDGTETSSWDYMTPVSGFAIFVSAKKTPYRYNGTTWLVDQPASISFFAGGLLTGGQLIAELLLPVPTELPSGLSGSLARVRVAGTAEVVISVQKNDVEVGTLTFAIGETVATVTSSAAISLAADDSLTFVGPATADATFAGLSVSLLGVRKSL